MYIDLEDQISVKKIIAFSFFGFIVGVYLFSALYVTIPFIYWIRYNIDFEIIQQNLIYQLLYYIIATFTASFISGFLGKQKGIISGVLANSFYFLLFIGLLIFAFLQNEPILILFSIILILVILFSSLIGGILGKKFYSPDKDLDWGNDKLTFFGVYWIHYFWIFPFIIYPYFISFIFTFYTFIVTIIAIFYFIIHPSLWLNLWRWFFIFTFPVVIFDSLAVFLIKSFSIFFRLMQYDNYDENKKLKRIIKIILFGLGAPIWSFVLNYLTLYHSTIIFDLNAFLSSVDNNIFLYTIIFVIILVFYTIPNIIFISRFIGFIFDFIKEKNSQRY
ncbi:MAG: hypothetical protein ABIN00_05455 [candidate division WOR-3 bacterium]